MIESNFIHTRLTHTQGEGGLYEHEFFVTNGVLICDLIHNGKLIRQMFAIPLKILFQFNDSIIDLLQDMAFTKQENG